MASAGQLFVIGFLAGIIIGVLLGSKRFVGCLPLSFVPIATIAYVHWWLDQDTERLTSTSGLLFLFAPIPPSAGALVGYGIVWVIRDWQATKDL